MHLFYTNKQSINLLLAEFTVTGTMQGIMSLLCYVRNAGKGTRLSDAN